jgi:CheY-like chemotaxis protein
MSDRGNQTLVPRDTLGTKNSPVPILIAEDDADDRQWTREALEESHLANPLYFVEDGEELLDFLRRGGRYKEPASSPRPGVILLDLNMPRKDGRETLREIRADPEFRQIPVLVLTTSQAPEDVCRSYELGANSFITKPVTFEGLVAVLKGLGQYWFDIVQLPEPRLGG